MKRASNLILIDVFEQVRRLLVQSDFVRHSSEFNAFDDW